MRLASAVTAGGVERELASLPSPIDLDRVLPAPATGDGSWQVELGFGKGRYLLRSALAHPDKRFLGVELITKYYRMLSRRATRAGASNLVTIRGEALYLLASALPRGFAEALHIYFPDPWPKKRHLRRRLLDPVTVDLVLGVLRPGGVLFFATDFIDYGERVAEILAGVSGLEVSRHEAPWPDGARTNYEAKYQREGRPIVRLSARVRVPLDLHPDGRAGILAAPR